MVRDMKDGRVERNIYYRKNHTISLYSVNVTINGIHHTGSFTTLTLARIFRDRAIKLKPRCKVCEVEITRGNFCVNCRKQSKHRSMFKTFIDKLVSEETKHDKTGFLLVKCYRCKNWFNPSFAEAWSRARAIEGKITGQHNFYCSQHCKNSCDVYRQRTRYKHQTPIHKQARCNQRTNRQALLDNQLDQYGYTFCEKCSTKTDQLSIHHNIMVSKYPSEADDMAHQLLVCGECHKHEEC